MLQAGVSERLPKTHREKQKERESKGKREIKHKGETEWGENKRHRNEAEREK